MCTRSARWGALARWITLFILIAAMAAPRPALAADVYSQRILSDGPVVYYRLDELANGTLQDELGNSTGTAVGATMGVAGALYSLSSTAIHVAPSVPSAVASNAVQVFAPGEGSLSVELWARPTTEGYLLEWPRRVLSQWSATAGFALKIDSGYLMVSAGPTGASGAWAAAQSAFAADGAWHHMVFVINRGNALMELYLDGTLAASGDLTTLYSMEYDTQSPSLYLGSVTPGSQADADLDELAIYKKALTATQIREHYVLGYHPLTVRSAADTGPGSLRSALTWANSLSGPQTIDFAVPGLTQPYIQTQSDLPPITKQVTIDGTTQTGYAGSPVVTLLLNQNSSYGLKVASGTGTVIRGLAIGAGGSGSAGVWASTGSATTSVLGCRLGMLPNGNQIPLSYGVRLESAGNTVGATGAHDSNTIANCNVGVLILGPTGRASSVLGNVIGLDASGTASGGVSVGVVSSGSTDNLIRGNTIVGGGHAVQIEGTTDSRVTVSANRIGLNAAGTAAIGNSEGIAITNAGANVIGGPTAADGNTFGGCPTAISLYGSDNNIIDCNNIGTNADGTATFTISAGVVLYGNASLNQIGRASAERPNRIAHTTGPGIVALEMASLANSFVNNIFEDNGGPAIDLWGNGLTPNDAGDSDEGPNRLQNYPVLTGAGVSGGNLTVTGTLDSATNCSAYPCNVLIYSVPTTPDTSGHGGTEAYLGQIQVTAPGAFTGTLPCSLAGGRNICAAAIDNDRNQSELGANLQVAGPATHLAFVSQPSNTVAGATMAPVSVELLDAGGQRAVGESRNVTLALTPTGGPPLGGTLTVAADHGLATFSTLAMPTVGTGYHLGATATGLTGATSGAFAITPAALDPTSTLITSDKATAQADDFEVVTLTLTARDRYGNAIAGVPAANIAVGGSPAAGLTVTQPTAATGANGRTTATAHCANVGSVTFTPSINAAPSTHTTAVRFLAGAPVPLHCDLHVNRTTATADGADSVTLTITLRDLQNRLVADVPAAQMQVQASPTDGVAITQPSTATNAAGQTTATATCTKAGSVSYTLLVGGVAAGSAQAVTYAAGPPAAATSTLSADKATAAASGTELVNFSVTLRDAQGNVCPGVPGSRVLLAAGPATGIDLVEPSSPTGAGGVTGAFCTATKAGRVTFTATLDGTALPGSAVVDFVPGPPHLGVSTVNPDQPTHRANGHDAAIITVTVQDIQGNPVPGVLASDIVVSSNRGSAVTITQPTGSTSAAGQITASATTTTAGLLVFSATLRGGALTDTAEVTFTPGVVSADLSTLAVDRASLAADGTDAAQITVTAKDANGNPLSALAASKVVLSVSPSAGTRLTQPSTATDTAGQTTGSLTCSRVGNVTVSAQVNGTTLTQTVRVGFVPGIIDADTSGVQADVAQIAANGSSAVLLTITLHDRDGHPIAGVAASRLRIVGTPSAGLAITQPTAVTDAAGQTTATVTGTRLGQVTFTATLDGGTMGTSTVVDFVAGAPLASASTLSADRAVAASDGHEGAVLSITLHDAQGHPVAGVTANRATFAASPSGGVTITPSGAPSDANGRITATATSSVIQTVTFSATFDSTPVSGAPQVSYSPHQPDLGHSLLSAATTSAVANGADRLTFTLTVRDNQDRPVTGIAAGRLRLTAAPATGLTLTQPSAATDASGQTTASLVGTVVGSFVCGMTLDGVAAGATVTVDLRPGAVSAASCLLTADKTTAASSGSDAVRLTATLRDALGNAVPGVLPARLSLAVAPSAGTSLIGPSGVTDAAGHTSWTLTSTTDATVACALSVDGSPTGASVQIVFNTLPPGVDSARCTLTADRATAAADGAEVVTFTATLVDTQGRRMAGVAADRLVLTPDVAAGLTLGAFGATDAEGHATATATSTSVGSRTFALRIDGQLAPQTVAVSFVAAAADATRSTLTASATTATANGGAAIILTLTLRDAHGNAIAGVPAAQVSLTSSGGAGSGLTLAGPAAASDASGRMTMTARASVAQAVRLVVAYGDLSWAVDVTFAAPTPAASRSTVSITPSSIAADGTEAAVLTVQLLDADGRPVPGSLPADRSVASSSLAVTVADAGAASDSQGRFTMRVTTRETGTTQLTVLANGVRLTPVTLTASGYYDVSLAAGVHFVGLPLTPAAGAYQALLASSGLDAAVFDATTQHYVAPGSSYAPGQGLWVSATTAVSRRVLGTPTTSAPVRLVLRRGWNALANPFGQAVDWDLSRLSVESGGVSLGHLQDTALWARVAPYGWTYNHATGYRLLADTSLAAFASAQGSLPVGAGFWFYAAQDGLTLVLPPPAAARVGRAPSAPKSGDWSLALRAVQGDQHGTALVGVSGSLAGGLTLAKPPAARGQAGLALSLLSADGTRLAGDLRGAGEATTWTLDVTAGATDEVVLNWPGLGRELPRGLALELRDGVTDGLTLLNTKAAWRWQPRAAGETRRLTLTARQGHVARATITGLDMAATRGVSAAIRLTLSAPAEVTVQVRGLGGRLVKTLTQSCEAGTTLLTWDGTDQSGRPVPAGSYRLEAQATSADGALAKTVRTVTLG